MNNPALRPGFLGGTNRRSSKTPIVDDLVRLAMMDEHVAIKGFAVVGLTAAARLARQHESCCGRHADPDA
jgi:hypothetical protein